MTPSPDAILSVRGLVKHFVKRDGLLGRETGRLRAVAGIDLDVRRGKTLGLVGESGCGKSTTGRLILRLLDPDAGTVLFDGGDIATLPQAQLRPLRRQMQLIFQDPFASLNPRLSMREIIEEPLIVHGIGSASERRDRIAATLRRVGIRPEMMGRFPHEFSGGQRQRIGIARALVLEPKLIVADEPLSALDVSVQASVMNLMQEIQAELGISFVLIAHDLAAVEHMSHDVAVMYLGRIVEIARAEELYEAPLHPYTQILMQSVPPLDPHAPRSWPRIEGEVPSPMAPPPGCPFHPRCPKRMSSCSEARPDLADVGGRKVACHLHTATPSAQTPVAEAS